MNPSQRNRYNVTIAMYMFPPRVTAALRATTTTTTTRSGELQNLWYHMDRNKVTREGFRRILLDATDSLCVTFPASPCPYPAGPAVAPGSEISYASGRTPVGGISVSGARQQLVLNRAAYEENLRRAAGSTITYGIEEMEGEWKYGGGGDGRVSTFCKRRGDGVGVGVCRCSLGSHVL